MVTVWMATKCACWPTWPRGRPRPSTHGQMCCAPTSNGSSLRHPSTATGCTKAGTPSGLASLSSLLLPLLLSRSDDALQNSSGFLRAERHGKRGLLEYRGITASHTSLSSLLCHHSPLIVKPPPLLFPRSFQLFKPCKTSYPHHTTPPTGFPVQNVTESPQQPPSPLVEVPSSPGMLPHRSEGPADLRNHFFC